MLLSGTDSELQQTTSYKAVLPFYIFAAFSFLISCILLLLNTGIIQEHYFHPKTLAITHLMALGWGTMIILGASHQLLPVLIEGKLDSYPLAILSFIFAATGIPLLVISFYLFNTGLLMQAGAILINASVICFFLNVIASIEGSKKYNVHALFMAAASLWLFITTFFGLMLVFNFSRSWLPQNSIEYLSLHAHIGLAGWFLLMVLGVSTRLIPMFLISKYSNPGILWWIFGLVNTGLLSFIVLKTLQTSEEYYYGPFLLILAALLLFAGYCYQAYKERIRKHVDEQMKISLLSVGMLFLPLISLLIVIVFITEKSGSNIVLLYGFSIFFGWITAIILGMTFKTLPFIIWNKKYRTNADIKTPAPKDLFSEKLFNIMAILYLTGFFIFIAGITSLNDILLKSGAVSLLMSAIVYVWNVIKVVLHKTGK
ncbi:cytochrome C oxidase subunit I [Daejeonella sp. H1SJ63]|uniref:cytochrome C oxidase subunit I n=1 Tax=Daejeonella sp. H1SJ63 TaxID=3034145 RepID=UPI0023EC09C6|nr:cytochrome C oxidase subunit I [Daejeonella sp. H1SJ63]